MTYTFVDYFLSLKKYKTDKQLSDPDFLEECWHGLVIKKQIKNKNGDLLFLGGSRVSELISHRIPIPSALTKELVDPKICDIIRDDYFRFLSKNFNEYILQNINDELIGMMKSDQNISQELISELESINDPKEFLLVTLIESLKIPNVFIQENEGVLWERGKNSIEVISDDIFKFGFTKRKKIKKDIVVIPVDSSFCLTLSSKLENDMNPKVSLDTIHGEWIRRCKNSNITISELENRVKDSLDNQNFQNTKTTNEKKYPFGSIVTLEINNAFFYLLAISEFDEDNVARSSKEDIKKAISSLIDYYDKKGQGHNLYIPLLGTGRSRANLENQESFELILDTLLENSEHIQGSVKIVALPEVYKNLLKGDYKSDI